MKYLVVEAAMASGRFRPKRHEFAVKFFVGSEYEHARIEARVQDAWAGTVRCIKVPRKREQLIHVGEGHVVGIQVNNLRVLGHIPRVKSGVGASEPKIQLGPAQLAFHPVAVHLLHVADHPAHLAQRRARRFAYSLR